MTTERPSAESGHPRWQLLRDLLVFQGKLLVDGFRDLVLVPVSVVAGIVSLMHRGVKPGDEFYDLLRLGRKSEAWINLFGAADPEPVAGKSSGPMPADIDRLVSRVESFIVDEYRSGEITGQARQRLDRALESLRPRRSGRPPS